MAVYYIVFLQIRLGASKLTVSGLHETTVDDHPAITSQRKSYGADLEWDRQRAHSEEGLHWRLGNKEFKSKRKGQS